LQRFNFIDLFQKIFLFICLIYAFIPFEAVSFISTNKIHRIFLILIMLYALYINSFKISKYGSIFFIIFLFFALINSFVSIGENIIIFAMSILFAAIVVPIIYQNNKFKNQFLVAIRWLIIFSITMFFLQFILYHITGEILLLHELIFPFSKARIAEELSYGNLMRMGGIYIEPGTYSNYMFIYIFIYLTLTRNIKDILLFIGAISIILTASVWGMIFASYFLVMLILSNLSMISVKNKLLFLSILIFVGYESVGYLEHNLAVQYALNKTQANDKANGSTGAKKFVYLKYKKEYINLLLLGQGFKPEFQKNTFSLQDSGVLLNMSIIFGIFFTGIFFITFILALLKITNYWIVLGSLPIFISKIYYWEPALYLLYFLVVYGAFLNYTKGKE